MCNLYRLDMPSNLFADIFDAKVQTDPWPGGYVAPKRAGPVIVQAEHSREIRPYVWGFPPPPKGRAPVTNVRNLESPFWTGILRRPDNRCLIPATSFQEWAGPVGNKTQHWFGMREGGVFGFAGIWRDVGDYVAFGMLTTEPNRLVEQYHPKAMPVILHPEDYEGWLTGDWQDAQKLVGPFPTQLMAHAEKDWRELEA